MGPGWSSLGHCVDALVDGMDVPDSRVHNYPLRWNAAPSQELLVIRPITRPAKSPWQAVRVDGIWETKELA